VKRELTPTKFQTIKPAGFNFSREYKEEEQNFGKTN
jgi:hypothetical protein